MAKKLAPVVGHAAMRLAQWRVTKWDVEYVLNNYDGDESAEIPGARKLTANLGERRIGIVVLPLADGTYRLCSVWAIRERRRR